MTTEKVNILEKIDQLYKEIDTKKNDIINFKQQIITKEKEIVDIENIIKNIKELLEISLSDNSSAASVSENTNEEMFEISSDNSSAVGISVDTTQPETAWKKKNSNVYNPSTNVTTQQAQQAQQTPLKSLIKKTFDIPFSRDNCKEFYDGIDKQINTNSKYAILNTFEKNFGVVVYNKNMSDEKYNSDVKDDFDYSIIAQNQINKAKKAIESVWNKLEGNDNEVIIVLINEENKYYFYNIKVGYTNNGNTKFIEEKYCQDNCPEYINWRKKYK
jgi:hypothetical protein